MTTPTKPSPSTGPAPQGGHTHFARRVWDCRIGASDIELPNGADAPMRRAVRQAFTELTGANPEFCFSGWGGKLDEIELAVVEHRLPSAAYEAEWHLRNAAPDLLQLARDVAEHFADSDAPLGMRARALIAKASTGGATS